MGENDFISSAAGAMAQEMSAAGTRIGVIGGTLSMAVLPAIRTNAAGECFWQPPYRMPVLRLIGLGPK